MDNFSSEQRTTVMAAVKSEGTELERQFIEPLLERGFGSFEFHADDLPGKPDLFKRSGHCHE